MRVKVTFYVEATDPNHPTGLTNADYEAVIDGIMQMGGEGGNVERVDEGPEPGKGGGPK